MAVSTKEKPDLQKKVHEVPHKPGVYLMRDRFNRVIYVGKARDLRKRVGSYFLPSKLAQADLKTRAMLDATWDFETHAAAFSPRPVQKGRWQPLLRSVRACRSASADIEFHAEKIRCAHIWTRLA